MQPMKLSDSIQLADFKTTPEGFLVFEKVRLARTGVQLYRVGDNGLQDTFPDKNPNDMVRIYRPPEEVFADESMKSLAGKPLTIEHAGGFVNAQNAKGRSLRSRVMNYQRIRFNN